MNRGLIVVISGPSGVGKTTVARAVQASLDGLFFSVSHTTRPPRGKEVNGRDYYFISQEEFREMIERGEFVEWAEVFGHLYGTSKKELEEKFRMGDVLLDIDVQGALSIKKLYPQSVRIILFPPSLKALRERMLKRGDTPPEQMEERLKKAIWELKHYPHFTHIVKNEDLERTIRTVQSIIIGERHRRDRMEEEARRIIWEK